jgi:hypothetical protein
LARTTILSDDLVRQLVAVGQVDILVGVPTFNHAATIENVVRTVHVGLAQHFPRERTVLISPDGGSDDGTPELVRHAPMADAELQGSPTLRTTHRVTSTHPGPPGRVAGVRAVLAAADLLQARTVVLVDPDVRSLEPDWIGALAGPVWRNEADIVLPIHARSRYEGALTTQLVRPLIGTAYGRRLSSSLTGAFGCSGRFAARMTAHPMWEREPSAPALDVWLLAIALADDLRIVQAELGLLVQSATGARTSLPELFRQVVGTSFTCLESFAAIWTARGEMRDVPVMERGMAPVEAGPGVDTAGMTERFRSGVRDLEPLLGEIVGAQTLARLQASAGGSGGGPLFSDELWVTTVHEFVVSAHRGVMHQDHLTQALVPLYLGRTASFFSEVAALDETEHRERVAALEREYERLRPRLVERWNADGR